MPAPSTRPSLWRQLARLVVLLTLLLLVAGAAGVWWAWQFAATPVVQHASTLVVPPGAGAARVSQLLQEQGIVRRDPRWYLWPRLVSLGACLQAGEHTLVAGATPAQLAVQLCTPVSRRDVRVTLPEGWDQWRIADRLAEVGLVDRDAFLAAVSDTALLAELGVPSTTAEGWLFPDTYAFAPEPSATEVVRTLVRRAQTVHREVLGEPIQPPDVPGAAGLTYADLVVLASVVEREAVVDEERAVIARVFYNRLATGMPLQSDPTCVYNATRYRAVPTRADCRDPNNGWSTYVVPALPPTPIANPGRAALTAVLAPSDDAELLYFVAMQDGTGRHAFSRTLAEHNRKVRQYLIDR